MNTTNPRSVRTLRYALYLAILAVALGIIWQNAWKAEQWWYYLSGPLVRHVMADPPGWEYYLHIPRGYAADGRQSDRTWPVLIYVHGTGGSGREGLHIWRRLADQEGFVYLAPTFPTEWYTHLRDGEDQVLWAMIAEVETKYRIDRGRIFVCGFSAGAQFAHRLAFKYPDQICGVSAMSAGSYDPPPRSARRVPFAVSVGEDDTERTELARWFATALKKNGFSVQYKTFPGVGHWVCYEAIELTMDLFRRTAGTGPGP